VGRNHVVGIVPAYRPGDKLAGLLKECIKRDFLECILVVDDGSGPEFASLFESISLLENVFVLHLGVNSGMGGAIKAGIQYATWRWPETIGFAAFDADGQHLPEDIQKVVTEFCSDHSKVVLGVRNFHDPRINIPLRSRFGNRVTEIMFYVLTGKYLADTQTGLRCYPVSIAKECVGIKNSRYEFQMESLLLCVQKCAIRQIPIQTVYEDGNKCSHFNPLLDSFRIYMVLLRFVVSSLICSVTDYIVFAFLFLLSGQMVSSLLVSRVCSVSLNFIINRNKVFRAGGDWRIQALGFLLLAVFLFEGSLLGMTWLKQTLGWNPLFSKIVVEVFLFIISFLVQRLWIFSNSKINERILSRSEGQ